MRGEAAACMCLATASDAVSLQCAGEGADRRDSQDQVWVPDLCILQQKDPCSPAHVWPWSLSQATQG